MGGTWEVLGRNMGGTFSFYLRYFFAFQSIPKRSSIEDKAKFYRRSIEHKAKFYRRSIEHLSNTYRRPIEHLSKTYRRWGEEGAEREQRGAEREQRKNLATKLQNSEVLFSPFWSLVSLNGTFWSLVSLNVFFGSSCSSPMLMLEASTKTHCSLLTTHHSLLLLSRVLASSQLRGPGLIRRQMLAHFPTAF